MLNHQARWDRKLPTEQDQLNERIWVAALFGNGKIFPRYFIWNKKLYRIKQITYNWQERIGADLINLFSVNTSKGLFQISFSQKLLSWKLDKLIV